MEDDRACIELEKVNETLEKERSLVLQTQENYNTLKAKFLELTETTQKQIDDLQKKLSEKDEHLDSVLHTSEALKTENGILREQVRQLELSLEEAGRVAKSREEQMKKDFEEQIEKLVESISTDNNEKTCLNCKVMNDDEILKQNEHIQSLLAEVRRVQCAADETVLALRTELREERERGIDLETTARSELNRRMKQDMEKEIAWLSKEENFRTMLMQRTASFEQKTAEFEREAEEKDELISDLRRQVDKLTDAQQQSITENSVKIEDEEKRRLKEDLKAKSNPSTQSTKTFTLLKLFQTLSIASKQNDEVNKAIIEELKKDRNKLEITIAELKNNAQAYPSKTAELNRLNRLLEEKDEKLNASRRSYRHLLRKVETSLIHLEKQQQQTKRKLEESFVAY
ncbi:unnamed protein product [Nippostrongylus brasiliensis]|uniref:Uncharacterized protein n=1 Tax=Nippostrongylus brasiliensis TaxID=27835 RepID=A0A0N4YDQ6_NIPBR|nr:unnamed protein product [Nippostrongylus brasiliensis]